MKKLKRFLYTFLSVCLFFQMTVPVEAKEEQYTYTVRFFAGKQGFFQDGEMMVFEGLHYGDRISFYQNAVTLNDNSKYYIRGIRESGKDNSDSVQTSSFLVTGDRDYVVAYGILGDATSYTINYVDSNGNPLAPSETYYGNVGDRPVVAYLYIEGWRPEAYNLTQTLEKDPAENVFNFVYTREPEAIPVQPSAPGATAPVPAVPTPVPAIGTGVTIIPAQTEPEVPPEADIPDDGIPADGNPPAPEGEEDQGEEQEIPDQDPPLNDGPENLVDLDEPDTPMGNFLGMAADARLLGIPLPVVILLAVAAVAAAWYLLFLKKKKKEDKEA